MRRLTLLNTNDTKAIQSSRETARSAHRLIRLHEAYMAVKPRDEPSLRRLYLRELIIIIRRASRLGSRLIICGFAKGGDICSNY